MKQRIVFALLALVVALNVVQVMRRASGKLLSQSNRLQKRIRQAEERRAQQQLWDEEGTLYVGSLM